MKSDILSKEEEARLQKEKKDKMDEIKKKYSRRSRQNSNSATRPPGGVKRAPSQVSDSSAGNRSAGRRIIRAGSRGASPANVLGDKTTKCTRDEDFNIEQFMREDMSQLNREED